MSYQGESDDKKLNFRHINETMADKYKMGAYERISFANNKINLRKKDVKINGSKNTHGRVIEELTNDGTLCY